MTVLCLGSLEEHGVIFGWHGAVISVDTRQSFELRFNRLGRLRMAPVNRYLRSRWLRLLMSAYATLFGGKQGGLLRKATTVLGNKDGTQVEVFFGRIRPVGVFFGSLWRYTASVVCPAGSVRRECRGR